MTAFEDGELWQMQSWNATLVHLFWAQNDSGEEVKIQQYESQIWLPGISCEFEQI